MNTLTDQILHHKKKTTNVKELNSYKVQCLKTVQLNQKSVTERQLENPQIKTLFFIIHEVKDEALRKIEIYYFYLDENISTIDENVWNEA